MTAAVEAGREEKTDDFDGQSRTDDTAAHGENVGIVVAPAVFCRKHVVAKSRPDSMNLVGCNTDADARSAKEDTSVVFTGGYGFGYFFCNNRIVAPFRRVGTRIGIGNTFFI